MTKKELQRQKKHVLQVQLISLSDEQLQGQLIRGQHTNIINAHWKGTEMTMSKKEIAKILLNVGAVELSPERTVYMGIRN